MSNIHEVIHKHKCVLVDQRATVLRDGIPQRRRPHVPPHERRQVLIPTGAGIKKNIHNTKNIVIHIKKYLPAVRGGDRAGSDVPARAQRDLPRPEAGQHSAGQRGPRQDRGLRDVSGELLQVASQQGDFSLSHGTSAERTRPTHSAAPRTTWRRVRYKLVLGLGSVEGFVSDDQVSLQRSCCPRLGGSTGTWRTGGATASSSTR